MARIHNRGTPVTTSGDLPTVGSRAPDFELVANDFSPLRRSDFAGKRIVLNVFPSIDTGLCATSVRKFNEIAAGLENTAVLCVSMDLPFAHARFCGAEGIANAVTASAFRGSFPTDYGVLQQDGPGAGLLARSVVVIDTDGSVLYSRYSPDSSEEPDYDGVIETLGDQVGAQR